MHHPKLAGPTVCATLPVLLLLLLPPAWAQDATRTITDSAGRRVEIPDRISRVLAAGPPASILLCTLAPERMIGWARMPSPNEKPFVLEKVRELPEYGRLTGRGGTANLESVLRFKPDLIIDSGSTNATYVSLANTVQEQTRLPYLLLDGRLESTPAIYRLLGDALGVQERAEKLAHYADETLVGPKARIASIPESERPRVYYGRGPNGLETGLAGSINMEVLERVGGVNVAAAAGKGGLTKVSLLSLGCHGPVVALGEGRARQARLPRPQSPLGLVRRAARRQSPDRRALADSDPLPAAVSREPARHHP